MSYLTAPLPTAFLPTAGTETSLNDPFLNSSNIEATPPPDASPGAGGFCPHSRDYVGFEQVIDRLPNTGPISAATLMRYAKNFPTLARAFESLPAATQFSKTELKEVLAILEKLDTNRDLKISELEVANMAPAFPELNKAFESMFIPKGFQISAAYVLKQMLNPTNLEGPGNQSARQELLRNIVR
jgi:hypothetical protein